MNQKDFNILLNEISNILNPINQLLYEILIIIVFFYFFYTVKNIKNHKSFIILITLICSILDLCIWNNYIQTSLFISILTIYIIYNLHIEKTLDTFLSTMNTLKISSNNNNKELLKEHELYIKNKNELEKITFIPKDLYEHNKLKNHDPKPYDKLQSNINEVNIAYQDIMPYINTVLETNK